MRWRFQEALSLFSSMLLSPSPAQLMVGGLQITAEDNEPGTIAKLSLMPVQQWSCLYCKNQCLSCVLNPWAAFSWPASPLLCQWIYIIFLCALFDCPVSSSSWDCLWVVSLYGDDKGKGQKLPWFISSLLHAGRAWFCGWVTPMPNTGGIFFT